MESVGISKGQRIFKTVLMGSALVSIPLLGLALNLGLDTPYLKGIIYLTFAAGYLTFIVFGIVLYWMRENQRWLYGLVEIAAALALVFITLFFLGVGGPKPDVGTNIYTIPFVTHLLQMLAAIYFLVRGLDNLGQGLRKFPVWNRRWRWLSLKPVDDVTKLKSDGQ